MAHKFDKIFQDVKAALSKKGRREGWMVGGREEQTNEQIRIREEGRIEEKEKERISLKRKGERILY